MSFSAINRAGYDKTALAYQRQTANIFIEERAAGFIRYLWPGQRILDLGCGPGSDLQHFYTKGFTVVGVDISEEMIKLARRAAPHVELIVSEIEAYEPEEKSFSAVWASASLIHVPKISMGFVLDKIHRCLVEGGIFYVSMKKGEGEGVSKDVRYDHVEKFWNYVSEEELTNLLKAHHFEIIDCTTYEMSTDYQTHPWIAVIARATKV